MVRFDWDSDKARENVRKHRISFVKLKLFGKVDYQIGAIPADEGELTLEEIAALSDVDIDYSGIPKPDDEYWAHAVVLEPKPTKELVSIRLDTDVIEFFKRPGAGYQTRINAVLRLWIKAQSAKEKRP